MAEERRSLSSNLENKGQNIIQDEELITSMSLLRQGMAKSSFQITLQSEQMDYISLFKQYMLPEHQELLVFRYEEEPNLEIGDIFRVNIAIEEESVISICGQCTEIIPPLRKPVSVEVCDEHCSIISKYLKDTLVKRVKKSYMGGETQRTDWTVLFERIKDGKE